MEEEAGGPVAYIELFRRTHKHKESGEFVSERAKEVVESYEQQLIERHGDDSSQHPQFDASAWLVAAGQPKKGRVFGFGTGMDAGGVINSTMESGCSAASYNYTQSPPPSQQPTKLPNHYCSALIRQLDSFGEVVGKQASSDADGDNLETHLADD
ncbi:hypothetical protein Taro_024695 [Colocasia esculenta]|uniref:Uncharacterized protein n=1 Tax=Colocasia esculenta TaxID=4460 RepID=A0A843V120_COLES|nr:hypothetical protein [Colocasia esculenta]